MGLHMNKRSRGKRFQEARRAPFRIVRGIYDLRVWLSVDASIPTDPQEDTERVTVVDE